MNGKRWSAFFISIGVFFLAQSFVVVWWASSINTRLGMMEETQVEIRQAIEEGMKDLGRASDRDLERQRIKDRAQDERINKLHTKTNVWEI